MLMLITTLFHYLRCFTHVVLVLFLYRIFHNDKNNGHHGKKFIQSAFVHTGTSMLTQ